MKSRKYLLHGSALCIALALALCLLPVPRGLTAYAETPDSDVFVPGLVPEEFALDYPVFVEADGIQSTSVLPATYGFTRGSDGRLNVLGQSAVKSQGSNGVCWAFAGVGAIEASLIKNGYGEQDLSEMHIAYSTSRYGASASDISNTAQGFNRTPDGGGNRSYFSAYMTRGTALGGSINEATDPYNESKIPFRALSDTEARGSLENKTYTARDYIFLTGAKSDTYPAQGSAADMRTIKEAVRSYGAVSVSMFYTGDPVVGTADETYFNKANNAYYLDAIQYTSDGFDRDTNHAVLIVGWDDNFPASSFNADHRPPGNGAWLVKNSWKGRWGGGDQGYYWQSYYDTNFPIHAYTVNGAEPYDRTQRVYEYEYRSAGSYWPQTSVARIYAVESGMESLKSVRMFLGGANTAVKIDVISSFTDFNGYTFPVSASEIEGSGSAEYPGWYTFDLDQPVPLGETGSKFAVVVRTAGEGLIPIGYDSSARAPAETSYTLKSNGILGSSDTNFSLKAITVPNTVESVSISPEAAEVNTGSETHFTATVIGENNPSQDVIWSVSGKRSANTKIENGVLTVAKNETSEALTVTARSRADSSKSGSAEITVKIPTYSITFNANGGSGAPAALTGLLGGSSAQLGSGIPTHASVSGKAVIFVGWTETPDPDISVYDADDTLPPYYSAGASYTVPERDVTLYALWGYDANRNGMADLWENTYTLAYDANGGNEGSAPAAQTGLLNGEKVTLSSGIPTHASVNGKAVMFVGWTEIRSSKVYIRGEALPSYYFSGEIYSMPAHDMTLYAVWQREPDPVNPTPSRLREHEAYITVADADVWEARKAPTAEMLAEGKQYYNAEMTYRITFDSLNEKNTFGAGIAVLSLYPSDTNDRSKAYDDQTALTEGANVSNWMHIPATNYVGSMPDRTAEGILSFRDGVIGHKSERRTDENGNYYCEYTISFSDIKAKPGDRFLVEIEPYIDSAGIVQMNLICDGSYRMIPTTDGHGGYIAIPGSGENIPASAVTAADIDGIVGQAITTPVAAKQIGGTSGGTFRLEGTLPVGLYLNAHTGIISGTPVEACSTAYAVTYITPDGKSTTSQMYHVIISSPDPSGTLDTYMGRFTVGDAEVYDMPQYYIKKLKLDAAPAGYNYYGAYVTVRFSYDETVPGMRPSGGGVVLKLGHSAGGPAYPSQSTMDKCVSVEYGVASILSYAGSMEYDANAEQIRYAVVYPGEDQLTMNTDEYGNKYFEFTVTLDGLLARPGDSFQIGMDAWYDNSGKSCLSIVGAGAFDQVISTSDNVDGFIVIPGGEDVISFRRDNVETDVIKALRWVGMDASVTGEPLDDGYDPSKTSDTVSVRLNGRPMPYNAANLSKAKELFKNISYEQLTYNGVNVLEVTDSADGLDIGGQFNISFGSDDSGNLTATMTLLKPTAVRMTMPDGSECLVATPGDVNLDGRMNANDWTTIMRYTLSANIPDDITDYPDFTLNGRPFDLWALLADMTNTEMEGSRKQMVNAVDWITIMKLLRSAWK
ncbi:MAG: InlB B-repeat-containing protein [Clostridia bacterium]|nr:InlB B-repeat-containing protein [Clostridia bacterium]